MSNHSGSYMLNEILKTPELQSVFQDIGIDKTQSLILKILQISDNYDCNSGEILDEIGEQFGICYCCKQRANTFIDGVCQSCYDTYFEPTYATNSEIDELISLVLKINNTQELNRKLNQNSIGVRLSLKKTDILLYDYKSFGHTLIVRKLNNQWIIDYGACYRLWWIFYFSCYVEMDGQEKHGSTTTR